MSDIRDRLAGLSPEQRAFVELQLQRRAAPQVDTIPRRGAADAPLSFAQQRLWLLHQLDPRSPAYVFPAALRLRGRLDRVALQRSLDELVRRHETLRTTFRLEGAEPRQHIAAPGTLPVEEDDLSALDPAARHLEAVRIVTEDAQRPFDLVQGPLVRARLVRLAPDDHVLGLMAHHIVTDGWSMGIFAREFGTLYRAYASGGAPTLPDLAIQYADFAAWQREWLTGERLAAQLQYWTRRLEGAPALELPTDRVRPAVASYRGAFETLRLSPELARRLKALGQEESASLFMTTLAGFNLVLARYAGQDDLVIGSPIANRSRPEVEGLIGFFVNSIVLRTSVAGDPTVRELIRVSRETALAAFAHQDVPFERLVDELQPERSVNRNPLFQVMFAVQHPAPDTLDLGDLAVGGFDFRVVTSRFDLEMFVLERDDSLALRLFYSTDLFDAGTIRRLLGHYACALQAMADDPDQRVSQVTLLSGEERQEIVTGFNATATRYPRESSIVSLFEAQAERMPDAVAVEHGDTAVTYGEVNARANRLAHRLRSLGVTTDSFVGILADRSVDMVVGLVAILKAGAAYVPLDPSYPPDRIAFMAADAGLSIVLCHESLRPLLDERLQERLTLVPLENASTPDAPPTNPEVAIESGRLAYVIYTSGSTGTPKGVAVPHRAVLRLICDTNYISISTDDRIAQASNSSFDAATFEIWGALCHGARMVIVDKAVVLSSEQLARVIKERGVTALFITTALFNQMSREAPEAFAPLRHLLFGGEAVDPACVAAVLRDGAPARLLHVYGPTETTTFATWHLVSAVSAADVTVPIGGALSNTTLYVLDERMEPVPLNVPGELYIGGDGVAVGYWRRPDLTAVRFVPDPFAASAGGRLYRTGDRVRWRSDAALEFLGRFDGQVKIRGFRIEPGEIDAALRTHPSVADAIATVWEPEPGDKQLVAYVVAREDVDDAAFEAELRAFLKERLPAYMVPSAIERLDRLPLNANGKVDRRALPAVPRKRRVAEAFVPPGTALERSISAIWQTVLNVDRVGAHDNFFDLGGHSLRLIELHRRLRETLDVDVPIVELFQFPTVASLARRLGGSEGTPAPAIATERPTGRKAKQSGIAIVAMAGRFPGAPDVETFWANVCNARESIRFFTDEDLRAGGTDESLLSNPRYVKAYGFLEDADLFDAGLFGYSPREAELIDPQQRLLLECAWEVLERAGYDPQTSGGRIGVFAGSGASQYLWRLLSRPDLLAAVGGLQALIGGGADFLATRASYKLNLRGPSVCIQTACSTSLAAVHAACRSLAEGECDMALAGGVSIRIPLVGGYVYQEEGVVSPDGHCRAFDARARGMVGGSGVALVALRRVEDAIADGDEIHAVIRGSAINNDGAAKVGYTAPSVQGQAAVIEAALVAAGVGADAIGYVEAHGTGTALGDPIEIAALSKAFAARASGTPVAVGSVKTNVGHLDAAAGVTGLIKAALVVRDAQLPPSLHFESPNPDLGLERTPFRINTRLQEWARDTAPRMAGVSSFGIGGTNVHVVVEQPPIRSVSDPGRSTPLLVLSARSTAALDHATERLADWLERHTHVPLADVAYTLQVGRTRLPHRRSLVCASHADAVAALRSRDPRRVHTVERDASGAAVSFLFPGQGAQRPDMGRGLYECESVFRAEIDRCAGLLAADLPADLRQVLYPAAGDLARATRSIDQTAWSQPVLFALEYALARLWQSWGIRPRAMLGHSLGEYVAACLAGVFSLEDALKLIAARARLMQDLPQGAMAAVALDEPGVRRWLADDLAIAAVNGPNATVVSGSPGAMAVFEASAKAAGVATRRLATSHAFHSPMIEPMLPAFARRLRDVRLSPPEIPYISNLTGTWVSAADVTSPDYWVEHARRPVLFAAGLDTLLAESDAALLEMGPGRALTTLARRRRTNLTCIASLPGGGGADGDVRETITALGDVWAHGADVDWRRLHLSDRRHRVVLPAYPFERRRYWIGAPAASVPVRADDARKRADVSSWFYVPVWRPSPLARRSGDDRPTAPQRWLLFEDGSGVLEALAEQLERDGQDVAAVTPGERFERRDDRAYSIDPGSADDYEALVRDLAERDRLPVRVVHGWCLTPGRRAEPTAGSLDEAKRRGFYSLVFLARALARHAPAVRCDIAVVGSGLHAVTADEPVAPEKALILGPARVIGQEYENVRCRTIDMAFASAREWERTRVVDQLAAELTGDCGQAAVAYRGVQRYVEQFESMPPGSGGPPLRDGGVYLITGGFGRIGLTLATHLARTARARLVLVGRSALPERAEWGAYVESAPAGDATRRRIEQVRAIEALGGEVLPIAADVADPIRFRAAVAQAEQRFGPIDGVVHAAGITSGDTMFAIAGLEPAECERQFAPKVSGVAVLEEALGDRPLDFCVLMSSLSTVLGGAGFAAYAAANAFMDAWAHERNRRHPVAWLSIDWDGWMMSEAAAAGPGSAVTALSMTPEEGSAAFTVALAAGAVGRVVVSTADLHARIERWVDRKARDRAAAVPLEGPLHERPALSREFVAPATDTEHVVAGIWQTLLGIDRIGAEDDFFELGGHSLLALQLLSRLRDVFGVEVSVHTVFNAPTVRELAALIDQSGAAAAGVETLDALLQLVEGLPEDELRNLLAAGPTE